MVRWNEAEARDTTFGEVTWLDEMTYGEFSKVTRESAICVYPFRQHGV